MNNTKKELDRILAILDNHSLILIEIKDKVNKIMDNNAKQNVDINWLDNRIENIRNLFEKHKNNHWKTAGLIISIAGVLSGIISFILNRK